MSGAEVFAAHKPTVFIATNSADQRAWLPIAAQLERDGCDVDVYQSDLIAGRGASLRVQIDSMSGLSIYHNGRLLDLDHIGSALYLRPEIFPYDQPDTARQMMLNKERAAAQSTLWNRIPSEAWLNDPGIQRQLLLDRLGLLDKARAAGFSIPEAMVTTSWDDAAKLPGKIVYGVSDGTLAQVREVPIINPSGQALLTRPFPGYLQELVDGSRVWHVFLIGPERSFTIAEYRGTDRWGNLPATPGQVDFALERLADEYLERCRVLKQICNLGYVVIRLVEQHDGRMIFSRLGVGDFMWVVDHLHVPIQAALASELGRIALSRMH